LGIETQDTPLSRPVSVVSDSPNPPSPSAPPLPVASPSGANQPPFSSPQVNFLTLLSLSLFSNYFTFFFKKKYNSLLHKKLLHQLTLTIFSKKIFSEWSKNHHPRFFCLTPQFVRF